MFKAKYLLNLVGAVEPLVGAIQQFYMMSD